MFPLLCSILQGTPLPPPARLPPARAAVRCLIHFWSCAGGAEAAPCIYAHRPPGSSCCGSTDLLPLVLLVLFPVWKHPCSSQVSQLAARSFRSSPARR